MDEEITPPSKNIVLLFFKRLSQVGFKKKKKLQKKKFKLNDFFPKYSYTNFN